MTIGELLKDYRIKQGKTQREFIAGIVSQSYYSKVEKEIHRITADDLLEILNHNGIPVKEFFEKLEIDPNQWQIDKINKLMEEITKASYSEQAIDQIRKIREKVKKLDLNPELKALQLLSGGRLFVDVVVLTVKLFSPTALTKPNDSYREIAAALSASTKSIICLGLLSSMALASMALPYPLRRKFSLTNTSKGSFSSNLWVMSI